MRTLKIAAAFGAAIALFATAAWAMTVQPVVVDLKPSGRGMSATISVENSAPTPLPIGISVQSIAFDEKGAKGTGKDPGDLLVYPPQAIVPAGQTQTFRVQWAGDPQLAQSKHYYVTVAQLPVKLPEGQSAIQILYNFQVLVNVGASVGKAQLSVASANIAMADAKQAPSQSKAGPQKQPQPEILVKNDGANYGYLSRATIEITQDDATGKQIFNRTLNGPEIQQIIGFGLIGPNAQRRVVLPVVLPNAQGMVKVRIVQPGDQP